MVTDCNKCLCNETCEIRTCSECYGGCDECEIYSQYHKRPSTKNCEYFKDRSKFIELPCTLKKGNRVFYIDDELGKVDEFEYKVIELSQSGFWVNSVVLEMSGSKINFPEYCMFEPFKNIGKTVFLTPEEAEQALKERENNG